jgi:hypothetical protein
MVRERRGTGVGDRWIRASARMKWKASMRFDGGEAVSARRRLGFGRGVGGEGAVLFTVMKPNEERRRKRGSRRGKRTNDQERERSAGEGAHSSLKRKELWL